MTTLYEPPSVEQLIYRDRDGRLRVRSRWTNADGKQVETDEGGVYMDADEFTRRTIEPMLRRTLLGRL